MASVSQVTSLRTNINSFGGQVVSLPGTNRLTNRVTGSTVLGGFGDNSISKYFKDLSELNQYKSAKICKGTSKIIGDYIKKFRSNADDLISITLNGTEIPESKVINGLFKSVNLTKKLFEDELFNYVFFGSTLMLIKFPKDGDLSKAKLEEVKDPFSSIVYYEVNKDEEEVYLNGVKVPESSEDGCPYIPLRFGKLDLTLSEDLLNMNLNSNDIVLSHSWKASNPLFGGLVIELKLYILKDILTQLVQIQDIVTPNLLLANVDKNTSQEKAVELATEIEKLINQYGDLTQLIASTADVTTLSQFILNNVRVYPDLLGVIRGTEKLDFSRLTGKNNEIRNELENTENQLVTSIGVPFDLYKGISSNRYDALKNSDRLLSTVEGGMQTIDESLIYFVTKLLKKIGKYNKDLVIVSNLFDYSFIRGINSSYKYDTSSQYISNLSKLAIDIKDTLESTKDIFDQAKLYSYLTDNAELIYSGFKDLLRKDLLDKLMKSELELDTEDNQEENKDKDYE